MYLKSLTMRGFKSFADKTTLDFEKGVTCIVGPNGSGKSNISDAVRWVLGEMSPKTLRGSKMEDIIFGGTSLRKPAGFAEVVMALDNSDRLSSCPSDEVIVCRRLYRTGDSEYYLNGDKVRLKDIVEVFLNTGIGREGYSVIGQGKISEVISQKGEERRSIFEEAAGISKLRYKKNEAQNKLAKTSDNLLRIKDILTEVEARLPSLERQAQKAKEYLVLREEKMRLEVSGFILRLSQISSELEKLGADYDFQSNRFEALSAKLEEIENEIDMTYTEAQRLKAELLRTQQERDGLIKASADKDQIISVKENDISHYKENLCTIEREISEFDLAKEEIAEQNRESLSQIEEIADEIKSVDEKISLVRDKILEKKNSMEALAKELLDAEAELGALNEKKAKNDLIIKEGESYNTIRNDRLESLEGEIASFGALYDAKSKELSKLREDTKTLKAEFDVCLAKTEEYNRKVRQDAEKEKELSDVKQDLRLKIMELQQRRETLLRMDRLLEGFSESVKAVMKANNLQGIHGPVSKLIKTDERYVTAIETTLGGAMQNIIVDSDASAKSAIEYLKKTNSGRATFLPVSTIKFYPVDTYGTEGMKGFVAMADTLVECDDIYRSIAGYLLGRTIVAEDLDSASKIAKDIKYKLRIVTLDGQVINAGGSFTGGQSLKKSGILSRRADIDKLSEQINELTARSDVLTREISDVAGKKTRAMGMLSELERENEIRKENIAECENSIKVLSERLYDTKERLDALCAEKDDILKTSLGTKDTLTSLLSQTESLVASIEKLTSVKSRTVKIREEVSGVTERLEAEMADLLVHKSVIGEKKRALEEKCEDIVIRLENIDVKKAQNEVRKAELLETISDTERLVASERLLKLELVKKTKESERKIDELRKAEVDTEAKSADCRALQKTVSAEKETAYKLVSDTKVRIEERQNEKNNILTSLFEDYDMDVEAARLYTESLDNSDSVMDEKQKAERLAELKIKIKRLGSVNVDAVEEYASEKERYDFLSSQYNDAQEAKENLEKMIISLEETMRKIFEKSLAKIRQSFKETFVELFGGGNADITVSGDDLLESSIDIYIQPPGKSVKNISLLSGGEQSIAAISLYLAIFKVSPSPFCIFDEIEAALDEANVARFAEYVKKYSPYTQFILITHRRGTMEAADALYGVTMQEKGVSDFIRVKLDEYDFSDVN